LTNLHILQLGTIDSRAQISHGAEVCIETPGVSTNMYINVANFDHYNMLIRTPFMRKHGVKLDFLKNQIVVTGVTMPTIRVIVSDTNDHMKQYQTVDKKWD